MEALAPWITPAIIVGVLVYVHRSIRQDMARMESRLRENMRHETAQLLEDMKQMESRLGSRMDRMEARLHEDMERLDGRVARLEHGQAKLEGLLEGLRAAITRPNAA